MKELEKENETMKEQLLKVEQMLDMVDKMEKEIEYKKKTTNKVVKENK